MDTPEIYEYPTFRPWEKRVIALAAVLIGVTSLALVSAGAAYIGVAYFGWQPVPSTAFGCALHKRFHSGTATRITSADLDVQPDCLNVRHAGSQTVLRDPQQLARVRAWFDTRSDLWFEGPLVGFRVIESSSPYIELWPCSHSARQKSGTLDIGDMRVAVNDDWIEASRGKGFRRPLCRGEWKQLEALLNDPRQPARVSGLR